MEDNKKTKTKNVIFNIISAVCGAAISFATTFGIVNTEKTKEIKGKLSAINTKAGSVVAMIKSGEVKQALVVAEEIVSDTKEVVKESKEIAQKAKENIADVKSKTEIKKIEKVEKTYK